MIELAMPAIWDTIAEEIHRLKKNDAWLARQLGVGRNTVNGWKSRGVPASRHDEIARLFGWKIDRLLYGAEASPAAPSADDLSPMALSLAKLFDEIRDDSQRMRAYALAVQIFTLGGLPPGGVAPTHLDPGATAPAAPSIPGRHTVK